MVTSSWARLEPLKDRFLSFWPNLGLVLVDLEKRHVVATDRVLVIGSGRRPKPIPGQVWNTDLRPFPGVRVMVDAQHLPFADAIFQVVVCHQVLEHLPDADRAVAEFHRVLGPGGKLIVSVPFFFPFHASPDDFRRWSLPGLRVTCRAFREIDSGIYQGPVGAFLTACQHFCGFLAPGFWFSYLVKAVVGYLLLPFRYLDRLAVKSQKAENMAISFYLVGVKGSAAGGEPVTPGHIGHPQ